MLQHSFYVGSGKNRPQTLGPRLDRVENLHFWGIEFINTIYDGGNRIGVCQMIVIYDLM